MRLGLLIPNIAQALVSLCMEHGPQSFNCWEVSDHGGGASSMQIGRVGRQRLAELQKEFESTPYKLLSYYGQFMMAARKPQATTPDRSYEVWTTITTTYRRRVTIPAKDSDAAEAAERARLETIDGIPDDYVLDDERIEVSACIASGEPALAPNVKKSRGRA